MHGFSIRTYTAVFVALLALLALTVGSAFVELGPWNPVANLGIAALKAALVVAVFMQLKLSSGLVRLAALAGLAWLVILFALTLADYLLGA